MINYLLFTFLVIFTTSLPPTTTSQPNRFLKPLSSAANPDPKQSLELTFPLPTAHLPLPPPECTLSLLTYSFGNTNSQQPYTVLYSPPPDCPPPWKTTVIQLSGEVSGNQYNHIAGFWLSGVELLRTSTPEPSENGKFWNVEKDVTKYISLFNQSDIPFSMMLENLVNDEVTGIYDVSLTLLFYQEDVNENGVLGSGVYDKPADLVIPVANMEGGHGYWFRIENELQKNIRRITVIKIPRNARRVVLEMYVSHHGDDEFWYSNPPTEYNMMNNLPTNRGNGAYREVFVKIDGNLVGFQVPFPVVFTEGINPSSWDPIVAIGAYDLPTYDIELTPFLGLLLDGEWHTYEIGVANSTSFWLVDANLHVWLDEGCDQVEAVSVVNQQPEYKEKLKYKFKQLDGFFKIKAERESETSVWVNCSTGNFTTTVTQKLKFKNTIEFQGAGTQKIIEQKAKMKTKVRVVATDGTVVSLRTSKQEYPLKIVTSTFPGPQIDTNHTTMMSTSISNELKKKYSDGMLETMYQNSQQSEGLILVRDNSVVAGRATTTQTLSLESQNCFTRSAEAADGKIVRDHSTVVCSSSQ